MKQLLIAAFASLCFVSSAHSAGMASDGHKPAGSTQNTVAFKIGKADIAEINLDKNALTIELNAATSKRFAAVTGAHVGDMMTLYYQDLPVQRAQINCMVDNGLIYVLNPSDALKHKVAPLLAGS